MINDRRQLADVFQQTIDIVNNCWKHRKYLRNIANICPMLRGNMPRTTRKHARNYEEI